METTVLSGTGAVLLERNPVKCFPAPCDLQQALWVAHHLPGFGGVCHIPVRFRDEWCEKPAQFTQLGSTRTSTCCPWIILTVAVKTDWGKVCVWSDGFWSI